MNRFLLKKNYFALTAYNMFLCQCSTVKSELTEERKKEREEDERGRERQTERSDGRKTETAT